MILKDIFNNLSIAKKITIVIATAAITTGGLSGLVSSFVAKDQVLQGIKADLKHYSSNVTEKVNLYLNNIKDDLNQTSDSNVTAEAIEKFDYAWQELENPKSDLQNAYIKNNPNPAGQKDKLAFANDGSFYSELHKNYHDVFEAQKDAKGYYDIFLINKKGDVVYSVYKEADFATNLNNGEWRDSELGQLFRDINQNPSQNSFIFKDFKPYAPSSNVPASFIGKAVFNNNNEYIGVIAFQLPIDRFSNLFQSQDQNIINYIVGSDDTLRNDIPQNPDNDILSTKSQIKNVAQYQGQFLQDYKGLIFDKSIYNIRKMSFSGTDWSFVAEYNQDVLVNNSRQVTFYAIGSAMLVSLITAILGFLYARSFARPISKLADTVDKLANGYDAEIPCKENADELGTLARSLTAIQNKAQESSRVTTAVEGASAMFMIANEDLEIIYANKSLKQSLQLSRDALRKSMPMLNLDKIEGTNLLEFHGDKNDHVKRMLKDLHSSYNAKISFDDRYFALVVSPVYDKSGNRIGFTTEWLEKTAEVHAEREAEKRRIQEQQIEAQVAEVIQAAASGNFKQRLNINDDRQSIITISNGINQICETVDTFFNDLNATVHAFSEGDLTKSLSGNYSGQFEEVKESLNQSFTGLCATIKEIATVGNAIKAASSDITTGADDLSGRTEAQAASIEETVATMEEMSASVRNNANSAVQASNLAQETLQQAENGRNVVSQAVVAMNQIETSAHRITEIVSVIDSIASQTNLLALNAAVEAARAGEAGKGFAVVASEVRTLASRCSEAARDIRGLITGSNAQVVDGVKLVNATGVALSQIVESVTNVTSTIASISQASREQATGIEEISGAISQMDEITQQNAGLADNSAANARELAKEAEALSDLVRAFKTETAASMLSSVNKKMTAERSKTKPASSPKKQELSFDSFSDFGAASGDDWSDL